VARLERRMAGAIWPDSRAWDRVQGGVYAASIRSTKALPPEIIQPVA
jgi:hypothetical protein